MMKRLTAFTLAVLMLINPMTAFAATWDDIVSSLKNYGTFSDGDVKADANNGAVTVHSGTVTEVDLDGEFSSYTFKDTVKIGGDVFYVFVDEGESVTVDIESDAVVSTINGIDADVNGGSLTVNNAGTVDDSIRAFGYGDAMVSISNSGSVGYEIDVDSMGENNVFSVINSGSVGELLDIDPDGDNDSFSVINSGTVGDEIDVDIDGIGNTVTVINSGIVTGDGDLEVDMDSGADGNTVTIMNSGTLEDELDINIDASNNTVTAINTGTVGGSMDAEVACIIGYDESDTPIYAPTTGNTVTLINSGDIAIDLDAMIHESNHNSITINNSKDIGGSLGIDIDHGSSNSVTINNKGNIGPTLNSGTEEVIYSDLYADVEGDGNSITIRSEGDIAGHLYVYNEGEGSIVIVNHDGNVSNQVLSGALCGGQSSVIVTGTADSAIVGGIDGKDATLGVLGGLNNGNPFIVDGENVGKVTLLIAAGNGAVVDPSVVEDICKNYVSIYEGEDYSGQPDSLEIITTDNQGNKTARYSVAPDGTVKLEEVYPQDSGSSYDDPATWTAERKRHDKEEERKAAAIGGVTGSPYWVKQLYLGYMSLNLRLFDGEEQLLFKEHLSWQKDGSKLLTLRTKLTDTSELMMRLDGMVIDKLHQAGISTIAIVDANGDLFMTYEVSDLEGARAMYGLGFTDYLVVGEATDDVMMIGADGKIVPIEGEEDTAA